MSQGDVKAVRVTIEDDPNWLSPYGPMRDSNGRALYSAIVTLTLGVLGSTILPVPYAFSKMGISVGVLTIMVVASVNVVTCCMLIRAAAYTGRYSYEELAEWAGGRRGKVITQASLILLLYGTMCGGLAFLSDVALVMVHKGMPGYAPALLQTDGRPVMVLVVLVVLLPLCLQRHIRQFEKAATVGVVVVIVLSAIIINKAVSLGFPAVRNGELPLFSLRLDRHLPEAFSVLGFAFYMQPFLLPVFKELPRGRPGVKIAEKAVNVVLYIAASLAYGTVGAFGASIYGQSTESNIMVNDVLDSPRATLALYSALMVYLCCGMVTTQYALRASVDTLLMGPNAPYAAGRHVLQTVCIIGAAMAVASTFPRQAEKIFALTGATAVCLSCYMIPVYIHLKLQSSLAAQGRSHCHSCRSTDSLGGSLHTQAPSEGPQISDCDPREAATGQPTVQAGHWRLEHQQGSGYEGLDTLASGEPPAPCNGTTAQGDPLQAPLLERGVGATWQGSCRACGASHAAARKPWCLTAALESAKPWLVLSVGVGCSVAGLWVAAVDFYNTYIV